jgi:DNA-binding beta-propeller fold protein YncE
MLKSFWWKTVLAASLAAAAWGGTFGTVVSIGGEASDLALDQTRGVLYIANFTANRIDVMTLSNNTIKTSINVAAQPSSIALSPDGHYLVATHFGPAAAPGSPSNALTVIDLTNQGTQTFSLGNAPLGVAFGADGIARPTSPQARSPHRLTDFRSTDWEAPLARLPSAMT